MEWILANQPDDDAVTDHPSPHEPSSEALSLQIPGLDDLTGIPRDQYELFMRRIAVDVLKEASNLANGKVSGKRGKQLEFHSTHIEKAVTLVSERGLTRSKRPWWYTGGRIAQGFFTALLAASGALMAVADAHPVWGYVFVGATAATILLLVVLEIADWSQKQ